MHRIAQRVHDGADLSWYAIQLDHVRSRHHDEIGEGAVPVHPDDLSPAAEVGIAQATLEAVAADDMTFGGDQITDRKQVVLLGFAAELGDAAGELVADHYRRLEPVACPTVPLPDMQVCTADAGLMYVNQGFRGSAGGNRHVAENDARAGGLFHEGTHGLTI